MILGSVIQQPAEYIDYDFDVSSLFNGDTDTLASFTGTSSPAGLTVIAVVRNTTTGKLWIGGGVAGVEYTVEFTATSVSGRIKQDELIVIVEEF